MRIVTWNCNRAIGRKLERFLNLPLIVDVKDPKPSLKPVKVSK